MRLACLLLLLAGTTGAQTVRYDVSFPNAVHHEARISVTLDQLEATPVRFRMSQTSPGRYAVHNFGKNVYALSASDEADRKLELQRVSAYEWEVAGHDGTVTMSYTLYADEVDGTYSAVDLTHAHLNMPATFMWAPGYEERPIEIRFEPVDESWKVATQLFPTDDPYIFTAPDLAYFLDSPTALAAFTERAWTIGTGDALQTIRLAVHHTGTDEDVDQLADKVRAIVDAQIDIFDEAPAFDNGEYVFICTFLPWAGSDGMEHRNSTVVIKNESLIDAEFKPHLGTISHEFLHAWNVERIRPADLEPFDFTAANLSRNLWFAEGFTTYYTTLAMRRAGLLTTDEYLAAAGRLIDTVVNSPGSAYNSPVGMSRPS